MDQQQTQEGQPGTSAGGASPPKTDEDKHDFFNTGRSGRRNAMPDILGNNCTASSGGDLPLKLSALTTNEISTSSQPTTSNEASSQETKK